MNAHAHHPWGLSQLAAPPWRHRHLLGQLIRREVLGRYRGSFLGLLWSFVNPALMISVYTFVFSVVFQARWGASASGSSNRIEFALLLFAGLIVFNLFAECLSQAPSLILNHTSYVKRVVFPLEILPWVTLGSALFHAGINLLVLLVAMTLTGQPPGWMALCWPLVIAPLLLLILGLTWLLASIGVFLRDIGQLVSMALTALSPVQSTTRSNLPRSAALPTQTLADSATPSTSRPGTSRRRRSASLVALYAREADIPRMCRAQFSGKNTSGSTRTSCPTPDRASNSATGAPSDPHPRSRTRLRWRPSNRSDSWPRVSAHDESIRIVGTGAMVTGVRRGVSGGRTWKAYANRPRTRTT